MQIHRISVFIVFFLFAGFAQAASNAWRVSTVDDRPVAITPKHGMILKMQKPNKGLWGKLYINLTTEQVESLKKHRLDPYFSFISVGLEVDRYVRNTNAKVIETKQFVRIDIDERMWESLKKGSKLTVYLPEGSTYIEKLKGSSKALRFLEKSIFRHYNR
ncbi:MAG: hypothetical protein MI867_03040 [Pseudomonadales bacterium]|nr:hypothetical protein [Pseudomonadales bacterium]